MANSYFIFKSNIKKIVGIFICLIILTAPLSGLGQSQNLELSEVEVFYRCFGQIGQSRPDILWPALLSQVKLGQKTAAQACIEVLKKSDFVQSGNTEISSRNDIIAKNVLQTFNNFHISWFSKKRFTTNEAFDINDLNADLYDATTPALYLTRALFSPNYTFSDILKGTTSVKSIRDNMSPSLGPSSGTSWKIQYTSIDGLTTTDWAGYFFSPSGTLYGVQQAPPLIAPTMITQSAPSVLRADLSLNLNGSHGGGLIGTQSYLISTIAEEGVVSTPHVYKTDGAVKMPRRWAKYIFSDLLCRELPVIRAGDGSPYVSASSSVSFRKSQSCTQCHASMDRMAMGARNLRYAVNQLDSNAYVTPRLGAFHAMYKVTPTLPQELKWPTSADVDFYKRPPVGSLYYRSYDGQLVHKSFNDLEGLGLAITNEKDFYVCTAKKYFEFFTGISVNLQDISDPLRPIQLGTRDKYYRDFVINLGLSLKQHQKLQNLIQDIISSEIYRKKDFGLGD